MANLRRAFGGFASLIIGLMITLRELSRTLFRRKAVTLRYPHEKPQLSPAYRSAIKLIRFEETNSHDCVACLACQNICPSYCIKIEGGKIEGIKKKRATAFTMDFALCSLCGLCIDVCPTDTLEYSKIYDEAGYDRDWNFDLLEAFREYEKQFIEEQREREDKEAAEKQAAKEAKAKAAAAAKAAKEAKAKAKAAAAEAKADDAPAEEPVAAQPDPAEPADGDSKGA